MKNLYHDRAFLSIPRGRLHRMPQNVRQNAFCAFFQELPVGGCGFGEIAPPARFCALNAEFPSPAQNAGREKGGLMGTKKVGASAGPRTKAGLMVAHEGET